MDATTKARLDKQAAAIRDLREQVAALRETLSAIEDLVAPLREIPAVPVPSASASTLPPGWRPSYGTYVPSPLCAMCGGPKEAGRTALTCKTCSAERLSIIREGGSREPITRSSCFSCGAAFRAQTRFLCPSCTTGHKKWAADQ